MGQRGPGGAPAETSPANRRKQVEYEQQSRGFSVHEIEFGAKPRDDRTRRGWLAKLTTEQRTKITSVIREQKVERVSLNVSVNVGTRIPTSVHVYPLPQQVIVIYPEWRGYDYILVGEQIVIINPRTHEIVAIIEA